MSNIVVFGPVESGKSTLLGTLLSHSLSDEDFQREAMHHIELINDIHITDTVKYPNETILLPSFVSLDRDEMVRFNYSQKNSSRNKINTNTTTKRVHRRVWHFDGENTSSTWLLLDTPGTQLTNYEKYRGIFEGDIGVYLIPASDALKWSQSSTNNLGLDKRLFDPLRYWKAYKQSAPLLIVLSKVDQIQSHTIKECKMILESLTDYLASSMNIKSLVVPLSSKVLVRDGAFSREEQNIFCPPNEKHKKWYNDVGYQGSFLMDELTLLCKKYSNGIDDHDATFRLAYIDQLRNIQPGRDRAVAQGETSALRIKPLVGNIIKNQEVIVGPITRNTSLEYYRGIVKSLKVEKEEIGESLHESQIGGVVLTSLANIDSSCEAHPIALSSIVLTDTSILATSPIDIGNVLCASFAKSDMSEQEVSSLLHLLPYALIKIYWFGKILTCFVITSKDDGNTIVIHLLPGFIDKSMDGEKPFMLPQNCESMLSQNGLLLLIPSYMDYYSWNLFVTPSSVSISNIDKTKSVVFSFAIEKNSILDAEDLKTILWEKGLKSNQITVQKDSDSSLDYIFDIECDADSPEGLFESIRKSLRPVKELFKDYYIHPSYFSYYVKEQGLGLST